VCEFVLKLDLASGWIDGVHLIYNQNKMRKNIEVMWSNTLTANLREMSDQ
jgi:hypothetical protein